LIVIVLLAQVLAARAEAAVGATAIAVPAREAVQARIAALRPRCSLVFIYFLSLARAEVARALRVGRGGGIISWAGVDCQDEGARSSKKNYVDFA
jgi:hypothetical protein